jgi:hypothetical protein
MSCGCNKSPCECHGQPRFPAPACWCHKDPCDCEGGRRIAARGERECSCHKTPCECCRGCTKCDLYVPGTPNVWVERGEASPDLFAAAQPDYKYIGICSLDTLKESQVIYIIERDEKARKDLLKVTSDPRLRHLALTVPKLPTQELVDAEQLNQNRPNEPASIPFYAVFRGQPPFPQ